MGDSVYLEKHAGKENLHRFYQLSVEADLFGNWLLTRRWGRVGQDGGHMATEQYDTVAEARESMNNKVQEKLKRGYQVS